LPRGHVQRVVAAVAGRQTQVPFDALLAAAERGVASSAGLLEGAAAAARGFGRAAVLAALLDVAAGATETGAALDDENIANALGVEALIPLALFIRGARLRCDANPGREQRHNQNKNRGYAAEQQTPTHRCRKRPPLFDPTAPC
jgi:hypothetical protein